MKPESNCLKRSLNFLEQTGYSSLVWNCFQNNKANWERAEFIKEITQVSRNNIHKSLLFGKSLSALSNNIETSPLFNWIKEEGLVSNRSSKWLYSILPIKGSYSIVDLPVIYTSLGMRIKHRLFRPHDFVYFGLDTFYLTEKAIEYVTDKKDSSLYCLDMCCGSGSVAFKLADMGHEVVGVDLNLRAINLANIAKSLNGGNISFIYNNLATFKTKKKFDLVLCNAPHVPVPIDIKYPLFGGAGKFGFDIVEELLTKLKDLLARQGLAIIVAHMHKELIQDLNSMFPNLEIKFTLIKKYNSYEFAQTRGFKQKEKWIRHFNKHNIKDAQIGFIYAWRRR